MELTAGHTTSNTEGNITVNRLGKKLFKKTEFWLLLTIIGLSLLIDFISNGVFFHVNNLVDLLRSVIIYALLGVGCQMVLISGGTDISFTALASVCEYACVRIFINWGTAEDGFAGSVIVIYLLAMLMGLILGALNGFIIAKFNLPVMIVTLGTMNIFSGILYGVMMAKESRIPTSMKEHGKNAILTVVNSETGLQATLPIAILLVLGIYFLAFFIRRYTTVGRGIFAIGGDESAAKRAGFNVFGVKMFIYCFSGVVAAMAGIARSSMMLTCNPGSMIGMEMYVIAGCVLGGTNPSGGSGSLTGAFLGALLITMVRNSLILIGVSTVWQKVILGLVIIIGTGISAYQKVLRDRQLHVLDINKEGNVA